jgi:hypothetical protein
MTKQSASKSGFPIGCLALLLLSALSASCIAPKPAGTSEQATSAQTVMATGRANISQRISELSAVINRVRPLASTQLLVTEPVMLPLTPVLESQINADFGIHKETTPGVFTLTPGGGSISVELLNGIDFGISNIDTNTTSGEIMSFQLNVTSNNRSIVTPVEQAAEIHITYQRFQIPILLANATPAGIIISGSVEFTRTGETRYRQRGDRLGHQ